jgi:hypothetical protein
MKYRLSHDDSIKTIKDFEIVKATQAAFIDNIIGQVLLGTPIDDTELSELIERAEADLAETIKLAERAIQNLSHRVDDSKLITGHPTLGH